ncbi:hypothetical protein [Streptomyces sp. enrichment culture]|uniref:hypothetical protein n=1 Tax=Streptomyces sp. enrichment culture TaxID=1795815 RepID=UPI003F57345B
MDFTTALGIVLAELDPKPWTYTTTDGTTLTIIPAGFRADHDAAEVIFRVGDIEEWVRTPDVQRLADALTAGESWTDVSYGWGLDVVTADAGVIVAVHQGDVTASVSLPPEQRLPLASALGRALDVARGWEDDA